MIIIIRICRRLCHSDKKLTQWRHVVGVDAIESVIE